MGVNGDGGVLAVPLLDNFVKKQHRQLADQREMTKDEALKMIKNTMNAVVEREITTGDSADIYIITPDGVEHELFELRKDCGSTQHCIYGHSRRRINCSGMCYTNFSGRKL